MKIFNSIQHNIDIAKYIRREKFINNHVKIDYVGETKPEAIKQIEEARSTLANWAASKGLRIEVAGLKDNSKKVLVSLRKKDNYKYPAIDKIIAADTEKLYRTTGKITKGNKVVRTEDHEEKFLSYFYRTISEMAKSPRLPH